MKESPPTLADTMALTLMTVVILMIFSVAWVTFKITGAKP